MNEAGSVRERERMEHLIAALRSGQFAQTQGALNRITPIATVDLGLCCLGVACEVAIADGLGLQRIAADNCYWYGDGEGEGSTTVLPVLAVRWYGFDDDNPYLKVPDEVAAEIDSEDFQEEYRGDVGHWAAAELNDEYKFTFAQIADCFEYTFLPGDWEVTRASR